MKTTLEENAGKNSVHEENESHIGVERKRK